MRRRLSCVGSAAAYGERALIGTDTRAGLVVSSLKVEIATPIDMCVQGLSVRPAREPCVQP